MKAGSLAPESARIKKPGKANWSKTEAYDRRLPVGAEVVPGRGVHFRVWAPNSKKVAVQFIQKRGAPSNDGREFPLAPKAQGYFEGFIAEAQVGSLYKYRLDSGAFPDPVSRFQPEGPHGPSQIIDPTQFQWNDQDWRGIGHTGQVIYELHLGTFTAEGTWAAAAKQLPELASLGVTLLEVMPVAEFPGRFGWGYDGVGLYAPTRLYGTPDEFRAFIDQAHRLGLGVILDVVYNHIGPDGNYLKEFSKDYFTDKYANEWGEPLNFDGKNSGPVREFFTANSVYWIEEFHLDGLRLDATQQMFDSSSEHILATISRTARAAARGRGIFFVAENESQQATLARPVESGGYGLNALWNDDFHHAAKVALTGRSEAYYSDFNGSPQELISAVKHGFLFQGQWSSWQKKSRGTPTTGLAPEQFVNYLDNHDQVANSLRGLRVHQLTDPGRYRALTALLLLGPGTPMLFQGQEFAASARFVFFADHHPELARLVVDGRRKFLRQFPCAASPENDQFLAVPHDEGSFRSCKLDFSQRQSHAAIYRMHRDLLKMRREDPVFSRPGAGNVDGAVLGAEAFVLRFFGEDGTDRLLLINLGSDLRLSPAPEPLLAPPQNRSWRLHWSSEAPCYGGGGQTPLSTEGQWVLPGHAAVLLVSG